MPQNLGFQVWSVCKMEDNISVPYLSAALGAPVLWTSVIIKNMFNIAGNKQIKEKSAFDIWNVWYPKPLLTISHRHYSSQCALITCLPDLTHQMRLYTQQPPSRQSDCVFRVTPLIRKEKSGWSQSKQEMIEGVTVGKKRSGGQISLFNCYDSSVFVLHHSLTRSSLQTIAPTKITMWENVSIL